MTLKELLENYQTAKQAENLLSSELNGITTKITQLTHELDELENKKAKLESIQFEAPTLMLSGKLSDAQFACRIRDET
jgi:Skp family chaperone for outer membrane proteins